MMSNIVNNETESLKILIVEDSATQAMALEYILEQSDYKVFAAHNGEEALALINQNKPAIVVSDIIMPGMDGYELCKRIKENELSRDIFVILLTSLSEPKDVIKSLQCGADKFLTKPYDKEVLLTAIEHLVHNEPLPDKGETTEAIEISYDGQKYSIKSSRAQILNLLISTYEAAVKKNTELIRTQEDLRNFNRDLEEKVKERTAALQSRNEELHIMSRQLWQAAKLATMGELTASIAHELNNPLATVNLRVESLLEQIPQEDCKRNALKIVEKEVERMANLVANLLQFSRRNAREISTIDIHKEINSALDLIQYHLRKYGITVQREFSPDTPFIHADRQQLRQLFLNLFTNSSDAMPRGGKLTIRVSKQGSGSRDRGSGVRDQGAGSREQRTGRREQGSGSREQGSGIGERGTGIEGRKAEDGEQTTAGVGLDSEAGYVTEQRAWFDGITNPDSRPPIPENSTFVVIEIADTGAGIPPEIMQKIMEPFFTTKPEGKGTGLGLPICRRIVQEHNGTLNIESEPGKGTLICIRLPVANRSHCT